MRIRGPLLLALFVLALGLLAPVSLRLPLDVESLSMKSTGTPEAHAEALRQREFGSEAVVILFARQRTPGEWTAGDEEGAEEWVRGLEASPSLARLHRLPVTEEPERHALLLAVEPKVEPDGRYADEVEDLVSTARRTLPPELELFLAGAPVVELELSKELVRERDRLIPVLLGVMALVLVIVYRSPALVASILLPPIGGAVLLGTLQAAVGSRLNPVSSLLAPVVLTVGVASAVHVVERYLLFLRHEEPVERATRLAASELRRPFLLAVLTTICGFLGLLASPIPAVRGFGVWAGAGVAICTLLACFVQPVALRVLHRAPHSAILPVVEQFGLASRFALFGRRYAKASVAVVAILSVVLSLGWSRLGVQPDPLTILPPDDVVRRDADVIRERTGVRATFDLVLEPEDVGAVRFLSLVTKIGLRDGIAGVADVRTSESGYRLLSLLVSDRAEDLSSVLADARRVAREGGFPDAVTAGLAARIEEDSRALVAAQLEGLGSTLLLLTLVMALGFRSLPLALLGLVPNVLPCLAAYGGMAFVGRSLTVSSAMIGTVMLGLIVDDTIHYIHAYRHAPGGRLASILRASRSVGRAVVVTSVCLAAGFASTLGGRLETTREFGVLATTVVIVALFANLLLVPAMSTIGGLRAASRRRRSSDRMRKGPAPKDRPQVD